MLMLELAPDCGIPSHLVLSQKQIILSRGLVKTFFCSCWGVNELCIILRRPAADKVEKKMKDEKLQSTNRSKSFLFMLGVTSCGERFEAPSYFSQKRKALRGLLKYIQKDSGDNEGLAPLSSVCELLVRKAKMQQSLSLAKRPRSPGSLHAGPNRRASELERSALSALAKDHQGEKT